MDGTLNTHSTERDGKLRTEIQTNRDYTKEMSTVLSARCVAIVTESARTQGWETRKYAVVSVRIYGHKNISCVSKKPMKHGFC